MNIYERNMRSCITAIIQNQSGKMYLPVRLKHTKDENIGLKHMGKFGVGIF